VGGWAQTQARKRTAEARLWQPLQAECEVACCSCPVKLTRALRQGLLLGPPEVDDVILQLDECAPRS